MATLRFLDCKPKLEEGLHSSPSRCVCLTAANLQCRVKNGEVVWAGCPVCGREAVVEISPDGNIGFFPMGTVVI